MAETRVAETRVAETRVAETSTIREAVTLSKEESNLTKPGKVKRKERKMKNEPQSLTMDDVPETIQVMDFFEARAKEFSGMVNALKKKSGSKRTFQKLPRHMRRRATSHNIKRLPIHLRGQASKEVDGSNVKKPSRKKRRRPKNLRAEYESRQTDKRWLETHIWHAKRMRMGTNWGYRIAESSNDKGCRTNYRYMRNSVIVSDISYYSCIELAGERRELIEFLNPMFPLEAGSLPMVDNGREIEVIMYKPRLYPYHCVGPVYILWHPLVQDTQSVWIWTHPSIYQEVLDIFQSEIDLLSNVASSVATPTPVVTVTSLSNQLLRFRLVGPKSLLLLKSVLHLKKELANSDDSGNLTIKEGEKLLKSVSKWEEISTTSSKRKWWHRNKPCLPLNSDDVKRELSSLMGDTISDGRAIGVVVEDPRLFTPDSRSNQYSAVKKGKIDWVQEMSQLLITGSEMAIDDATLEGNKDQIESHESVLSEDVDIKNVDCNPSILRKSLSVSPLWSFGIRNDVSSSKIPDHIINEVRGQCLDGIDLGSEASAVPVILVNKTYSQLDKPRPSRVPITGWDLIIPVQWGMAFWIPIIYQGARACGLKELSTCVNLECLVPRFPNDYPDAQAGQLAINEKGLQLESKYNRYPPDKRPNFGKLRLPYPFKENWNDILTQSDTAVKRLPEEPSTDCKKVRLNEGGVAITSHDKNDAFYVLRSPQEIEALSRFIDTLFSKCWRRVRTADKYTQLCSKYDISNLVSHHRKGLIVVRLEVWSRGKLLPQSTISLPTASDLEDVKTGTHAVGPQESLCSGGLTLVEGGALCIGEHGLPSKSIQLVRKQRKGMQKQKQEESDDSSLVDVYKLTPVNPSRLTIGRIYDTVEYRHTTSRDSAIGHCTLSGLIELCRVCFIARSNQLLAFTRGHNSQYTTTLLTVAK